MANGDVVCSCCDSSAQRVYGNVYVDRIADVYNGWRYRELREWLLHSQPDSWCPAINEHCSRRNTPVLPIEEFDPNCDLPLRGHTLDDGRAIPVEPSSRLDGLPIKVLQLEAISYCNLRCPICPVTNFEKDPVLREKRSNKMLPLDVMLDVIRQLPDLKTILYYNYGEPFAHRATIPFLREVRRQRPDIYIATNTNGLLLTSTQIEALANEALMDKIVFSIDGADPESYAKYRVGGELSRVLQRLDTLVKACRSAGTLGKVDIVWQYILFEWNDSDKELARAQELARQIGVKINWIITTGYGPSRRFIHGSPELARLAGDESVLHYARHARLRRDNEVLRRLPGHIGLDIYREYSGTCDLLNLTDTPATPTPLTAHPRPIWGRIPKRLGRMIAKHFRNAVSCSRTTACLPTPARGTDALQPSVRIRSDVTSITAPRAAMLQFSFQVTNPTDRHWDAGQPPRLLLAAQLRTTDGKRIRELCGTHLPAEVLRPSGKGSLNLILAMPEQPGQYQLLIDMLEDGVRWFVNWGSQPLICPMHVE